MLLVAPTEPRLLARLGTISPVPETYGADYLFLVGNGLVGIQRKEVTDLVASAHDGRLGKELAQMTQLDQAICCVEGDWLWDGQGVSRLVRGRPFTLAQWNGIQLSHQANGVWMVTTPNLLGTVEFLEHLPAWLQREDHLSLFSRPKARGRWGTPSSAEWAVHFWQAFEGIGIVTARNLVAHLGLPFRFTCTLEDLVAVPGIGKPTAARLMAALESPLEVPAPEPPTLEQGMLCEI